MVHEYDQNLILYFKRDTMCIVCVNRLFKFDYQILILCSLYCSQQQLNEPSSEEQGAKSLNTSKSTGRKKRKSTLELFRKPKRKSDGIFIFGSFKH